MRCISCNENKPPAHKPDFKAASNDLSYVTRGNDGHYVNHMRSGLC